MNVKMIRKLTVPPIVVSFVCHWILGRHFTATRPEHPDPATGAIHYYKGVRGIAYLTDVEMALLNGTWWLAFGLAGILVFLMFRYPDQYK